MFKYIGYAILGGILSWLVWFGSLITGHETTEADVWLLFLAYLGVIFFLLYRLTQDRGHEFAFVLVLPIFMVLGLYTIIEVFNYGFLRWTPDSKAFTVECSKVEVKYIKPPTLPVHSIAYDWDTTEAPSFVDYKIVNGTRISGFINFGAPYNNSQHFDFIETNHTQAIESKCLSASFRYLRFPKNAGCYGAGQLTADILVKYKTTPLEPSKKEGAIRYELTVSDRRNGYKLAYLRYVVDFKKQRACGLSGEGTLNDGQFIQKAIGL